MAETLGHSDVQTAPSPADGASTLAESRAVIRPIEAGSYVDCKACGDRVKFQAKIRLLQVICNVYEDGRWLRVEHYHEACYLEADLPHGQPA